MPKKNPFNVYGPAREDLFAVLENRGIDTKRKISSWRDERTGITFFRGYRRGAPKGC